MTDRRAFSEVRILAPAKVNLGLEIRGRRPDGYHEVRTVYQAVSLCDRLVLRRRGGGIRLRAPDFSGPEEDNLAFRAADLFLRETGVKGGVDILLEKKIPVGGGLGGGSSDAAAVLLGAARLYGLRPPAGDLARWAASLGSDVPFFLTGGAARGTGRGELIEPLADRGPAVAVLLHAPDFQSSTAAVYGDYRPRRLTRGKDEITILLRCWKKGGPGALGRALFNDLEHTVFRRHPRLEKRKTRLRELGALGAIVSGSGSCLFGLFPDRLGARRAARKLDAEFSGRSMVAEFLPPRRRWGVVKR